MMGRLGWPLVATAVAVLALVGSAVVLLAVPRGPSAGELAVAVHDAPCTECAHVWIGFDSVMVHSSNSSGGGWVTLNVSGSVVDLMALNGTSVAKVIGIASVPAGQYEQVRIQVTNVTVILVDGVTLVAFLPQVSSADLDGNFTVPAGGSTTISIDIDLATSLHLVAQGPTPSATFTPRLGSVVVE
jgi:Domain of unknown function (DUF4382)